MTDNLRAKIYNLISQQLGIDKELIIPKAHFAEDLNVGELEIMELATKLENEFNIEINREELARVNVVEDLVEIVSDHLDGLVKQENGSDSYL